jgi:glutaminyl-tRNA synthetase
MRLWINKECETMTEEKKTNTPETEEVTESKNFILSFIDEDIAEGGQFQGMTVHTRFPPEPNGYLHIGHCKALTIDFGTAERYNGLCNLRMDDTNPTKEDEEFVEAIKQDIHWLGFDWGDRFFYGSDYFKEDYRQAVLLIKKGLAYVCELTPEEFKANRGDIGIPAVSPYRDRPIEESLDLFARMRAGEFPNGAMTLRAKIDLTSGNFNMRDPVIYRINHMSHHRQGNKWCIYPMYDFAHPIQDALEGITHSLCSLEFEAHRPLYNWVIEHCELPAHPRQIEFARLGIDHTVMSKRKLRKLVEENYVSGWDDPRMPTLCGLRRRGYTAAAIRSFCERIGVAKSPNTIEYSFLEHCLREDLNAHAERTMAVLHPVKLTVTNYPEGKSETFAVENNPTDPAQGTHDITFSRHLWIEEDDFMEVPVPKYKRLTPNGPECRLKGAYLVKCTGCVKDESGKVVEVLCEYDPASSGGDPADGRKVKGATLHWVDAENCIDAEVRQYDNLFSDAAPDGPDKDFLDCLNPDSLTVLTGCKVEPEMRKVAAEFDKQENRTGVNAPTFQFMRVGYFCLDNRDCSAEHLVFNRSVSLKDSFKK